MNNLVSIIVPVFNKEKYILRCLHSLFNQDYKDIEIIVVDDGSTDSSKKIVEKLQDERLKLFSLKNNGVSNARNFGLFKCRGAYVTFVDADDYVKKDYITSLISNMTSNCDIVVMSRVEVNSTAKKIEFFDYEGEINNLPEKFYKDGFCHSVWGKLYKTYIIKNNNILFPKYNISEDSFFNLKYLSSSSIIRCINETNYYYIKHRDNNLTSFSRFEYLLVYAELYESYKIFFEDKKYDITKEIMYPQFYNLIIKLVRNNKIYDIKNNKLFKEIKEKYIKKVCNVRKDNFIEKLMNTCIIYEQWILLKFIIKLIGLKDR